VSDLNMAGVTHSLSAPDIPTLEAQAQRQAAALQSQGRRSSQPPMVLSAVTTTAPAATSSSAAVQTVDDDHHAVELGQTALPGRVQASALSMVNQSNSSIHTVSAEQLNQESALQLAQKRLEDATRQLQDMYGSTSVALRACIDAFCLCSVIWYAVLCSQL